MEDIELFKKLMEIADRDLAQSKDLYDHPCAIAVREINHMRITLRAGDYTRNEAGRYEKTHNIKRGERCNWG